MNWKIGTKLIMVGSGVWRDNITKILFEGPQKNDIVTFDGQQSDTYIYFKEWNILDADGDRNAYNKSAFRPLLGESARTELISSFVEVTETSDCPINVPQTETTCS